MSVFFYGDLMLAILANIFIVRLSSINLRKSSFKKSSDHLDKIFLVHSLCVLYTNSRKKNQKFRSRYKKNPHYPL